MDYGAAAGWGQVASSLISTYYSNHTAKVKAQVSNRIRDLNNQTVDAENARDAAITGFQRWRQKVYNDRVRQNAENDQYALSVNFFRQQDAQTRGNFAAEIQHAEAQGRMAAAAGASGVTGSVTDMISATYRLKAAQEQQVRKQGQTQQLYDFNMKKAALWQADMDQQDLSLIFDNPRQHDIRTDIPATQSWLTGINVKDVKAIAQGTNFSFGNNVPDSFTDLLHSNRSLGD